MNRSMAGRPALLVFAAALILCASATLAGAEDLLLHGATVHTVSGGVLDPGDVRVHDGKIAEVGPQLSAEGATVVDLKGLHLFPGLIAATSSLGLTEIGAVRATQDTNEVGSFSPDVESWIAVNPDSELIPVARANGITHALTIPQGGVVSGRSGLIALAGWTPEEMTVKPSVAMHLFWPGMELNLGPRPEGKVGKDWKSPEEQAEARRVKLKELDDFFEEARAYWNARLAAHASGGTAGIPEGRISPAWEAMGKLILGEIPLMIHADEVRQIRAAVTWAAGKGIATILAGGRDAWMVADLLAEKKIPVIYEAVMEQPARDTEPYDVHFTAPEVLRKAGVKVAIGPGVGSWAAADARNLPYKAAQARAFGMPADEALKAITLYPAAILGVADRLGSIEPGKEASLFAADGDILDIRSHVMRMWIAGAAVSLESRHTRLYDKYRNRPPKK